MTGRWLGRLARFVGASIGAFAGLVAIQVLRLRRLRFLPAHPGFAINHLVHPSAGGETATGRPLRLIVLGDSTAAGVGVDRPEDALPYRLAVRLADARRRAVRVTSYGWAGARAADLARDQIPRARRPLAGAASEPPLHGADVVAVVIGANDATHRTRPSRFRRELRTALRAIRDDAHRARVVLAGIPAFGGALRQIEPLIWITDQYARALRPIARAEAAAAGVAYADLAREVPPRIRGRRDILAPDRFHLSAAGYAVWADVIAEAVLAVRDDPPVVPAVTTQVADA